MGGIFSILGANRAAGNISSSNIAAEHGVLGATGAAENDITQALYNPYLGISQYQNASAAFNPYVASGTQGTNEAQQFAANSPQFAPTSTNALSSFALSNPQFSFNPSQYFNSPAYNFQLQQGQGAITNAASAMGLGASGNTLRDLTTFGQGLAANYYNQAFNQAQSTFGTNEQATLANLGALYGQQQGTYQTNQQDELARIQTLLQSGQFGTAEQAKLANATAQFGLAGNEALGETGMAGAGAAGGYAVGAGTTQAAGNLATGQGIENIALGVLSGLGFL